MLATLAEKANNLPQLPGVYLMLDEHGEVIYVGKAKISTGIICPKWKPWSRKSMISM